MDCMTSPQPQTREAAPTSQSDWLKLFSNITSSLLLLPPTTSISPSSPESLSDTYRVAQLIDHTLLTPGASAEQITTLCYEAVKYRFRTVCVRPEHVAQAKRELSSSSASSLKGRRPSSQVNDEEGGENKVGVACVVGFPIDKRDAAPRYSTEEKVTEATTAVADGATELDMVMNYEELKSAAAAAAAATVPTTATATATATATTNKSPQDDHQGYAAIHADIAAVRNAIPDSTPLKVILETSQLTDQDVIRACIVCCLAGADFVKTSTGFRGPGATVTTVRLMSEVCDVCSREGLTKEGKIVRVKASGGIRTVENVRDMVVAGAERIGASASVDILHCVGDGWDGKGVARSTGEY